MFRRFQQNRLSKRLVAYTFSCLIYGVFQCSTGIADRPPSVTNRIDDAVHLQGMDWTLLHGAELTPVEHEGQDALWFRPRHSQSIALLTNERFTSGVLEFDLAVDYRSCPTFALFADKQGRNFGRLAIKPWPVFDPNESHSRLRQAIVVSQNNGSINLHFNARGPVPESLYRWFHIRLVVQGKRCEVFVDDDKKPALSVDMPYTPNTGAYIGLIQQSCYLKGIRIHTFDS